MSKRNTLTLHNWEIQNKTIFQWHFRTIDLPVLVFATAIKTKRTRKILLSIIWIAFLTDKFQWTTLETKLLDKRTLHSRSDNGLQINQFLSSSTLWLTNCHAIKTFAWLLSHGQVLSGIRNNLMREKFFTSNHSKNFLLQADREILGRKTRPSWWLNSSVLV
jgi:hypothetical protein